MSKIKTYFEETSTELLTKVSWPTWAELQGSAVVVFIASIIISLVVLTMDMSSSFLMEKFYGFVK